MPSAISDTIVHERNSFLRIFPPHPISEPTAVLDLKYNSYYIADADADHIYFGNSTAPSHIVIANSMLADTQHVTISSKNLENLKFTSVSVTIDPPYFFITDGTLPAYSADRLTTGLQNVSWLIALFLCLPALWKNKLAIRASNAVTKEDMLGIADKDTARFFENILKKQIDGVFCTDGMFCFNKELSRLVYTYFYRNQFIVMDTNMTVLYQGNTIDTVSHAKINVDSVVRKNERAYTMSAPPLMVNKKSYSWQNWLFVNSDLLSRNEDEAAFNQSSVIDIYDLQSGKYEFSFYIHDFAKAKMRGFQVVNEQLYAMFDHFIVSYDLTESFFSSIRNNVSGLQIN